MKISEERKQQITDTIARYPHAEAAQGGGLVVWDELLRGHVFVLPPTWGNYKEGDPMPEEWGTAPTSMAD